MTEAPTTLHPDDGDIIRWMDGALPPAEHATMETHFATCPSCVARRERLAGRAERLSRLLTATDVDAPATALRPVVHRRKGRSTVAWKVAATILVVVGAAAAVTPVRAWFAGVARTVWAGFDKAKEAARPEGSVSFIPAGAAVTIRVPARAGASLAIEVIEGDRVTTVGDASGVLVLPEELRFTNDPNATGDYVVRVPLKAETLRVFVGQSPARTFKPRQVGDRWVIPLDQLTP